MAPPIQIHVSPRDDAPIYRQIVRQVVEGVASGALSAGEQLPSLRALGQKLTIAPLTVKKAYDVLEAEGVIETRRGHGTFVAPGAARSTQRPVDRLRPLARRLVIEAQVAGLDGAALAALLDEEATALKSERDTRGEAS
ncbi:MAG: GntR family transcriptional regulator [Planctomycetota bacterium]